MSFAVCALLKQGDKYLAVSCTKKTGVVDDWGLPGGKVEAGEGFYDAVAREVEEETGLVIKDYPSLIYGAQCGKYMVLTYKAAFTGEVRSSDEGEARWVTKEELLASHCTYREYNAKVFDQLEKLEAQNKKR